MQARINKAQLEKLPIASHDNPIIVVDTQEAEKDALEVLFEHSVLGFDTETRPSFTKGERHQVSLLQFATPSQSFLFRVNLLGFSPKMINLLEDPSFLKVGLSLRDDHREIVHKAKIKPCGLIDLQLMAPAYGIKDSSLQKIYAILFGKRISKAQQLSNWEAKKLSPAQQHYAALDALACLEIYQRFLELPQPAPAEFGRLYFEGD